MSPLRKLQGMSYWIMDDPDEVADFINIDVRKELGADVEGWSKSQG